MNGFDVGFFLKLLFGFASASVVVLYFIPFLSVFAHKFNILDVPNSELKKHKAPVPYLGGIAVYLGFIVSLALNFPYHNYLLLFLVGITLLLFVGLIDDLIVMKPYQKIIGQMLAVICFLKGGYYLKETFLLSYSGSMSIFWIFLSGIWMLTIINAFNLIDIMDGLASTVAFCSGFLFLIASLLLNAPITASLLLVALLGAVGGFLWYNKPPASMYLGDAGSLFIGGFLAAVPFMIPWGTYNVYGYFAPIIILLIPCLEVGFLILIRTWKRIPFYQGSPDHFAIYLQNKGWNKKTILLYMVFLHIILGSIALSFAFGRLSFTEVAIILESFVVFWAFSLQH